MIAFTVYDLDGAEHGAGPRLGLHEAMAARDLPRTDSVRVRLPHYRGKSVIPLLSWLIAERLTNENAQVSWYLERQQGPDSCAALLDNVGWLGVIEAARGKACSDRLLASRARPASRTPAFLCRRHWS